MELEERQARAQALCTQFAIDLNVEAQVGAGKLDPEIGQVLQEQLLTDMLFDDDLL